MADTSKIRMNLAAIKKVDPYAKDIVETSSHVAFYTFNSAQNEWEKTDVEGAFFIYHRNAQPFYSIFINNRINTTSFVEPITATLEIQTQPPFLLYRNERSRIRGFWFYNSNECERISDFVISLKKSGLETSSSVSNHILSPQEKKNDVNIFSLLSKAQHQQQHNNVLQFFASAMATPSDVPSINRLLPNTLSVTQLEEQQQFKNSPEESTDKHSILKLSMQNPTNDISQSSNQLHTLFNSLNIPPRSSVDRIKPFSNPNNSVSFVENEILQKDHVSAKPALMPPTMFENPLNCAKSLFKSNSTRNEPLNPNQLVQAFKFLLEHDNDFVEKLHDAYIKVALQKEHI